MATNVETQPDKTTIESYNAAYVELRDAMRAFTSDPNTTPTLADRFVRVIFDKKTGQHNAAAINNMERLASAFADYHNVPANYIPGQAIGGNGQNCKDQCRSLTGELVGFSKHICGKPATD